MRTAALIIIVAAALAQTGDALRIRAGICKDRLCNERTRVAFEPARVNVQVYVARDTANRTMAYGVRCDGVVVAESRVDVDANYAPLYVVEYRDIRAGECHAEAVLVRADGSRRTARSETLLVQSRQ